MSNQNNTLSVETPVDDDAIWVAAPSGMSVKVSITGGAVYADIWRDEAYLDDAPVATCRADLPLAVESIESGRYVEVEFTAQATINDRIIEVDPEGPRCFLVSETEALKLTGHTSLEAIASNTFQSDELSRASTAPEWVRRWRGPFDCEIVRIGEMAEQAV
jgi:hypothetical protein